LGAAAAAAVRFVAIRTNLRQRVLFPRTEARSGP